MQPQDPVALTHSHLEQLQQLLRENHLPWQDCEQQLAHFYGYFENQQLLAAGGLEPAGDSALLRSVVVDAASRSQGQGRLMVDFLIQRARDSGINEVYLLSETAVDYFAAIGFTVATRASLPEAIRQTRQFQSLCPDDATCMRLKL